MVLEDAAQAVGNEYDGIPAGNFGIARVTEFLNVTKNLGAAGDGG